MSVPGRLAILIPVFNDPEGLRCSLDSLAAASRPEGLVTLVVDDGSVPPVNVEPESYRAIGLELLRLPRNQGIEAALNAGLKRLLDGQAAAFIARLDAGDTVRPDRLGKQLAYLESHPAVAIVGSDVNFVDAGGAVLFRQRPPADDAGIRRYMHFSAALMHPAVMMRADSLLRIGAAYSCRYPAAEDYELFFRLLGVGMAASIPEALTTTVAVSGISVRKRRTQLWSRLRIQWRFFRATAPESYAGVALTLLLLLAPASLVNAAKRRLGSAPF